MYIALFWPRWYTQSAQAWITQFYLQITSVSDVTGQTDIKLYRQVADRSTKPEYAKT